MERSIMKENEDIDPVLNFLSKTNSKQQIAEQILNKYDENNKKFFIKQILNEEDNPVFDCIYQYDDNQIQLEYRLIWKIISTESNFEELNILLKDINYPMNLSFEEQIQLIIDKFDQYFYHFKEESSKPSTIIELDEEQPESIDLNQKLNRLTPPVTSNRIRHDSSCSSANSIKYTEFVPPSTTSVRRRRVIQSIQLLVEQKKKFLNQFKQKSTEPIIYQLGLEFLRLYDGKFNYPPGHTFALPFKNRTWFLTINNIKCVECQLGQPEPRSVLILEYKNKFTTVQV